MADIYYREDTSAGYTVVYIGNDSTAVGSTTKWNVEKGAICLRKRARIIGDTFILPENAQYLFYGVSMFVNGSLDMSKWDASQCTNMTSMFEACYLNDIDISAWDLSNVTTMKRMFRLCQNLYTVSINTPTPSLTNTMEMFSNDGTASGGMPIKTISLRGFTVNNLTNSSLMFWNCYSLSQILTNENTDWAKEVPAGTTHLDLFSGCTNLPNWDVDSTIGRANTDWYFTGVREWTACKVYMKV